MMKTPNMQLITEGVTSVQVQLPVCGILGYANQINVWPFWK